MFREGKTSAVSVHCTPYGHRVEGLCKNVQNVKSLITVKPHKSNANTLTFLLMGKYQDFYGIFH